MGNIEKNQKSIGKLISLFNISQKSFLIKNILLSLSNFKLLGNK
jgi:hypothetical protein